MDAEAYQELSQWIASLRDPGSLQELEELAVDLADTFSDEEDPDTLSRVDKLHEKIRNQYLVIEGEAQKELGYSQIGKWGFYVVDPEQIPKRFWMLRHFDICAHVNAFGEDNDIPGIKVCRKSKTG